MNSGIIWDILGLLFICGIIAIGIIVVIFAVITMIQGIAENNTEYMFMGIIGIPMGLFLAIGYFLLFFVWRD